MKRDLLAPEHTDVLARFAASELLLAFDFDGTLAPIVSEPDEARLRPRTRELLVRLSTLYPCIVISGRAVADVRDRVRGVGFLEVIGNHGLEPWRHSDAFAKKVRSWLPRLHHRLAGIDGLVIEDKGFSVAVHYRKSRGKRVARQAVHDAAGELGPLRIVGGHCVVNLLPEGAPHKGIALSAARKRLGCDTTMYVGDDETDEDAFGAEEPDRLLAVRVGYLAGSRAGFFLKAQADVDALLSRLIELRSPHAARKAASARETV